MMLMMVSMQRSWLNAGFLGLGLALFAGCDTKTRLEVAPVSGRVESQGQGVPRATVIFHPTGNAAEGAKRLRPFGYADDAGNFKMKTYVTDDGAPPGEYQVTIIAASAPSANSGPSKDGPAVESTPTTAGPKIPPAVSAKYANVETSGITVEIKEQDNQLEPFQLQ